MHSGSTTLLLLALVAACGGADTTASAGTPPNGEAPAPGGSEADGPQRDAAFALAIDGRATSLRSQASLTVLEGEPLVTLTLTGGDEQDNFITITAPLEGPENIRRLHALPFGPAEDVGAYASASLEGQAYSSQAGAFEVSFAPTGGLQGTYEITFSPFEGLPAGVAAGEAADPGPAAESITLSGEFSGGFNVVCSSPVRGFTGSHAVSDSPYCQRLEL
jgi:hypothetical protein